MSQDRQPIAYEIYFNHTIKVYIVVVIYSKDPNEHLEFGLWDHVVEWIADHRLGTR